MNVKQLSHRIRYQSRDLAVVLPARQLRRWWHDLEGMSDWYGLDPELLLAVVCVEHALDSLPGDAERVWHVMPRAVFAQRLPDIKAADLPFQLALDVAARLLRRMRHQFVRLSLALVAYHTNPDWVDDRGEAVLDDPAMQDYVQAVLSTMAWLCQLRPWRAWDGYAVPDVHQPLKPIDWTDYDDDSPKPGLR